MKKMYGIKYQLSDTPLPRRHKTLETAKKEQQRCYRAQTDDVQMINIVKWDGDRWSYYQSEDWDVEASAWLK